VNSNTKTKKSKPKKAQLPAQGSSAIRWPASPAANPRWSIGWVASKKIAIVTFQAQNTRKSQFKGHSYGKGAAQIVFAGYAGGLANDPEVPRLGRADDAREVRCAIEGSDVLLRIVDASRVSPESRNSMLLQKGRNASLPEKQFFLNKGSTPSGEAQGPAMIDRFPPKEFDFAAIVPIPSKGKTGLDGLVGTKSFELLPEKPSYFPEDPVTPPPDSGPSGFSLPRSFERS